MSVLQPKPQDRLTRDLNRTTAIALAAAFLAVAAIVSAIVLATGARGQDDEHYRFNLYAANHGAGVAAMRFKVHVDGPGPLAVCYVIGAIAVEALNAMYPDKDFTGGCAGGELLTLRELADRALALLPKNQSQGELP